MKAQDGESFAKALKEVLKSYRQECGTFTLKIWWAALEKHSLDTVLNAMAAYCADPDKCKFAPKAGDIVGMIDGNKVDRKELAVLAFARVLEHVNSYASVVFDDPAIHYAIQVGFGSWVEVGKFNGNEFECQEQRRAFISAYTAFKQGVAYMPRLIGIHEQNEVATGIPSGVQTLYIGDKQKALEVEQCGRVGQESLSGLNIGDALPVISTVEAAA